MNHKPWRSGARIISFSKETPIGRCVSGIPEDKQPFYDSFPGIHGSNGTYVTNESPYWCLKYVVYESSPFYREHCDYYIDMHEYITQNLMPKLGWQKISSTRLEQLKSFIEGKKINVIATHIDEAALNNEYKPEDYNTWEEFFDDVFKDVQ